MLSGSFRELQTHAEKVRVVVGMPLTGRDLIALCTGDKFQRSVHIRVGDNYDEIAAGQSRFATTLPGVLGSYFETWILSSPDKYTLSKAYLHLHASSSPVELPRELLFVHTEPLIAPAASDARQQRLMRWRSGPHLHVKAADFGLGRCHIHLDSCRLSCPALGSLGAYRDSLQTMIEMLTDELMEYFDPSQVT